MATLVVPGVRVEARFDVLPPLPATAGILGVVGIVDRVPAAGGLTGVGKVSEIKELLGPGTETSMPELVHALANGASEAMVSPVAGGSPASLTLLNADGNACVLLRMRSAGAWANRLRAEVRGIADSNGATVRVGLRLLDRGRVVDEFQDLQVAPGQTDDLFETLNQRSRYVVAVDPGFVGATPAEGTFGFNEDGDAIDVAEAGGARVLVQLLPADSVTPAGLSVRIEVSDAGRIEVRVLQGGLQEQFADLTMDPDSAQFMPYVLLTQSRLIRVRTMNSRAGAARLPAATVEPRPFAGGTSPGIDDYRAAIDRLADDTRIDLVLASIDQDPAANAAAQNALASQVHQALVAHAVAMADNGAPRIAFGSVTQNEQSELGRIRDHAAAVRNRRFVLVSPSGADGAVAGLIGRMNSQDSPTFKTTPLHGLAAARYRESELNRLLGPTTNLLVVQDRAGRGIVVLKGIDTTGDQISVTRVADLCIRETKAISENFIGRLNTEEARIALKQQLFATFTRMERDGALVPSTDGRDPAFFVDVYSTTLDFAQGIVRVDIAVRPVRSIDYIYATIRVKNQ
ncbi:MAG TPA: phage tail sheath C-terminal domain-containing protein [Dehalococcoidia bacterium]|nr:phage tail sheath C-terminal domain-containing protein [Dehalococcoidia bacterium]